MLEDTNSLDGAHINTKQTQVSARFILHVQGLNLSIKELQMCQNFEDAIFLAIARMLTTCTYFSLKRKTFRYNIYINNLFCCDSQNIMN